MDTLFAQVSKLRNERKIQGDSSVDQFKGYWLTTRDSRPLEVIKPDDGSGYNSL